MKSTDVLMSPTEEMVYIVDDDPKVREERIRFRACDTHMCTPTSGSIRARLS